MLARARCGRLALCLRLAGVVRVVAPHLLPPRPQSRPVQPPLGLRPLVRLVVLLLLVVVVRLLAVLRLRPPLARLVRRGRRPPKRRLSGPRAVALVGRLVLVGEERRPVGLRPEHVSVSLLRCPCFCVVFGLRVVLGPAACLCSLCGLPSWLVLLLLFALRGSNETFPGCSASSIRVESTRLS